MDQWLDMLSEDWVSQPRSPHSGQARRSSSALSAASLTSCASQSRIPRYKPRSASTLPSANAVPSKSASTAPSSSTRKDALKERSLSNLNISRNRDPGTAARVRGSPGAKTKTGSKRLPSTESVASIPQDTIQHRNPRTSRTKENEPESTPEWKRRVLQGKVGGTAPDLFGPIGLESMFKPPTIDRASKSREKQKRGRAYQPVQIEEFPSSPPTFPSDFAVVERSGGTDRRRSSLRKKMEVLKEVSEGDSRNTLSEIDLPGPEQAEHLAGMTGPTAADFGGAEEDQNEVLSQVMLPKVGHNDRASSSTPNRSSNDREGDIAAAIELQRREEAGAPELHRNDSTFATSPTPSILGHFAIPSLPDDLSTGTDLYVANGGFVNVRRGGYSNEGSFQRRPLSPSSLPDFDASELRSPSPTRGRLSLRSRKREESEGLPVEPRSAPVTPKGKRFEASGSGDEPRSSGSPLKLFDKYDTFTNERLIRRISKFERSMHESEEEQSEAEQHPGGSLYAPKHARIQNGQIPATQAMKPRQTRRIDSFGEGQLDSYPFNADHQIEPKPLFTADAFNARKADEDEKSLFQGLTVESHAAESIANEVDGTRKINGKRLPYSPPKESYAKRRRTLRSSDEMKLEIHQYTKKTDVVSTAHATSQHNIAIGSQAPEHIPVMSRSLAGRKRKDARYDDESQVADPKILALRQILRPRTPTPSQRYSQPGLSAVAHQLSKPLNTDQSNGDDTPVIDLDHQTQQLAGELATFTLNIAQDKTQGGRKASVTTADFFNEAKQIMQLIRNQGRPQDSQVIAEEDEPEDYDDDMQRFPGENSTIDEFSRPPSREGGSLRRLREPAQLDARVASHLRRYEDTDDLGLALPSSVKSMHVTESHNPTLSPDKSVDKKAGEASFDGHSDPPNLRIRTRPRGQTAESDATWEQDGRLTVTGTGAHSAKSQSSSSSTNRSIPTGSSHGSRGSGTKAVIAPQVVSHLLSDNMGAMTFDHSKQVWVKRKGPRKSQGAGSHSRTGSDVTEDFFKDIPDLSVDEQQEQQRAQGATASIKNQGSSSDQISYHDHAVEDPDNGASSRPQTRDSATLEMTDQGSALSKPSRFASSGPAPETRATSWGDEMLATKATSVIAHASTGNPATIDNRHSEEVEHEISILEGRTSEAPHHVHQRQRQPRVVTVAFSSPLVDQIQILRDENDAAASEEDDSDLDLADSPFRDDARPLSASRRRATSGFGKRGPYRNASRRASNGFARPMSRVDEHEEITFLQTFKGRHNASMELIVTTPLPVSRNTPLQSALSSAYGSSMGFQLSPLSEFTVHKHDDLDKHDISHAVKHRGLLATHEVEGRLSLAVQDLVKKLTDVEPYEPYWDNIRQLDLRDRGLATLHHLDEFCGHVENLDVSDNELNQLHGAPSWIRHLQARSNSLSNITSWSHLHNLQYLDVSNNRIRSLIGFQSLVHLRELKANANQIECLDGVLELDGLIKLTLRRNCIKSIDLRTCNLKRLTDLDLRQNSLAEVISLDQLPELRRLYLSDNKIDGISISKDMETLQALKLARNRMQTIDIGRMPNLRALDIDQNSIGSISNIETHKCLEVLSWREQRVEAEVQYQQCRNIRELHLSGNSLSSFAPTVHLLNLQHLELASTGLRSLADDFGIKCPNVRELNLNFNALSELRPLLGVIGLEKLCVAGNRVSRLRRTASVLESIGSVLTEIDLRQNPVTLGYYTSQQQPRNVAEQGLIVLSQHTHADKSEDDVDGNLRHRNLYEVPGPEQEADEAARQRLDEDTKIRRRVYELLVTLNCGKLKRLDGLFIDRRKVTSRDGVWERLIDLGVVVTSKASKGACELEG
ncbi:MAG: hypothetical protein LQ341_002957 [Variospora aurantia]|nr:MAG: hypothetical protein LQ341_002957 [Variospora aurantia]